MAPDNTEPVHRSPATLFCYTLQAVSQALTQAAKGSGCGGVSTALAQAQAVAEAQGNGKAAAGGWTAGCSVRRAEFPILAYHAWEWSTRKSAC